MMTTIFSEFQLKGRKIKNRVVFPPVVCFHYAGEDGMVTERNIAHYRKRAQGGAGIIITEATAVWEDGRLAPFQLGIWSEEHIPGMSQIASVVKGAGALSILQIHHAGLVTPETVSPLAKGPSADEKNPRSRALTVQEIEEIREAFVLGAIRAQKAGFDGVELHGAHGYLLNQFANPVFNKREDDYGRDLHGRMKLITGIHSGIRQACGEKFILGCRLGANSPTLEEGVLIAKYLENLGIDYLNISHGGILQNLPRPPKDFDYNWIVYCGTEIKKQVSTPVMVVNEIKTAERANWLVEHNLTDFTVLGRPILADPDWVNHVRNGEPVNPCLSCKPRCRWYEDSSLCPAVKRLESTEA